MSFCTSCGAQLGFGRFCTNCGQPTPSTDPSPASEVETTQIRLPRVQPDAATGPRFPLYADATDPARTPTDAPGGSPAEGSHPGKTNPGSTDPGSTNPTGIPAVTAAPAAPYPTAPPSSQPRHQAPSRSRWPWIALVLALLLGAGGGVWALLGDDGATDASGEESTGQPAPPEPAESTEPSDPGGSSGQLSESPSPDLPDPPEGDPVDLAGEADVAAPSPRPPGQTADGKPVRYPASNMLDADPATSYQISGDATGSLITFSFDSPVTLREIGMINGYAKSEGGNDWYAKNRKILQVEWGFDDGSSVTQDLRRTTDLQVLPLDPTTTRTVTLTLLRVSKPGPDPRDNTAISSVLLRGTR